MRRAAIRAAHRIRGDDDPEALAQSVSNFALDDSNDTFPSNSQEAQRRVGAGGSRPVLTIRGRPRNNDCDDREDGHIGVFRHESGSDKADYDEDSQGDFQINNEFDQVDFDNAELDGEDRAFLAAANARIQNERSHVGATTTDLALRAHENPPSMAASSRTPAVPARQAVRNGIVQQWEPSLHRTDATTSATSVQAPPTPPTNAEEERDLRNREIYHQMQLQAEENGIERPKGYNVSFHYNKRVENMHFGRTHPMKPWRLTLTKHLVMGYGLHFAMDTYNSLPASKTAVAAFHDPEYVDFLSRVSPKTFDHLCTLYANRIPPGSSDDIVKLGPFNLSTSPGADCPVFDGMSEYLFQYTGASLEAASALINHQSDIAINWSGGLHHAHKAEASGFCYINDIVLAILEFLKVHQRVLYIDIDVHHGDGVEEAFNSSDRVMTISFHRYGLVADVNPPHLFFPGTGAVTDNGRPKSFGEHFALNVPISAGINDDEYIRLFKSVVGKTLETFRPGAIVLQCGADSLGGDRLGQFNLNIKAHGECLAFVKKAGVPLLIVGGGGYTARNVARAWCHETALAVNATLNDELPAFLPRPQAFQGRTHGDYRLYPDLKGYHNNECSRKELDSIIEKCHEELRYVQHAPSVVCESLPPLAKRIELARQVEEEMAREKEEESRKGDSTRKRRERNTGGRGELR